MSLSWLCVAMVCICSGLLTSQCYATTVYNHAIYIDPTNGHDNISCIISNDPSAPCQSLKWALLPEHRSNSTQYVLREGKHFLNESVEVFEQLGSVAFTGANMNTTLIECNATNMIGFVFIDITTIKFSNLTFNKCSTLCNSTTRNFAKKEFTLQKFLAGLYFYHCRDVSMSQITVSNSSYATGVVMYDTDGTVEIMDSIFTNNTVPIEVLDKEETYPGGGGFYVEFSYCIPGDEACKNNGSRESRNKQAQYIFSNCTFTLNEANGKNDATTSYIIPYQSDHNAFGRGGGLSIFFNGNASSNVFNISNCRFISNKALWGAGLFVEFHDDSANNTVNVSNSEFIKNECNFTTDAGTGGGGMRIGHYVYTENSIGIGNRIYLDTLMFDNNSALTGGGLSISPTLQAVGHRNVSTIRVINSNFTNNVARLGSAIQIDRFSLIINGHILNVSIEGCNISNNSNNYTSRIPHYKESPFPIGLGAVYIKNVDVSFRNSTKHFMLFSHNNGSALAVVGSSVDFRNCTAFFTTNTGSNGAGIALLGAAYIQVNGNTLIYFFSNTAATEGGAIYNKYIERENIQSETNCFIRHENYFLPPTQWGSNFTFFHNHDHRGKRLNAIHTTSILPCARAGGSSINASSVFCWDGWDYVDRVEKNCKLQISTDVGNISFTHGKHRTKAFPGMSFSLPLTIKDDLQKDITSRTVFFASVDTPNVTIGSGNDNFTYVSGESTLIKGNSSLHPFITVQLDSLGERVWHMKLEVELQPCPPGFRLQESERNNSKDSKGVCKCETVNSVTDSTYNGALLCDPDAFKSFLKSQHWMGQLKDGVYVVSQCPPGYCYNKPNSVYAVLHNGGNHWNQSLDELFCGKKSRTNVSCGQCIDGYGPAVNSLTFECVYCNESDSNVSISSNIAKYVASVYLPLFVMFTILILFDIRLTTGPANAFILYCQVVASTFDLDADGEIPLDRITNNNADKLLNAYRFPYGFFNLEFIENFLHPLCLGTHFNNLSVFLLDYAVAISPILMIIVIILCVKLKDFVIDKCRCCLRSNQGRAGLAISQTATRRFLIIQRNINEAILPGFAAFILLSYTKFSLTSSYLVRYQPLLYPNGSYNSYIAYYAGQFELKSSEYIRYYALPAIVVFATFVLIPPLVLLDYPLRAFEWAIGKVDCLWKFYPVDKVHLFLDTFQGCYKNKMRFFAGLYFLFRLVVNASYIFTNTWLEQYVVQQLACTIMIMLLAFCQPYNDENKVFNYIDTFIFTNLAAINALSFYMYSFSQNNAHVNLPTSAFAIQYILVFLPLIYMLGYITWVVIITRIVKIYAARTGFQPLNNVTRNIAAASTSAPNSQADFGASTEYMLARAEEKNTYQPEIIPDSMSSKRSTDTKSARSSEDSRFGSRSTKSNSSSSKYGSTGATYTSNSN